MALCGVVLLAYLWMAALGEEMIQVPCVFMETCVLPCTFNDEEEEPQIIEWFREEDNAVVHAVQKGVDDLYQSEVFKGRTALFEEQISEGNMSLQLSAVRVEDQGTYLCHIIGTNSVKRMRVNLRVERPVTAVSLEQKGDVLVCSSEGIYPQPNVSWSTTSQNGQTQVEKTKQQLYSVSNSLQLDSRLHPQLLQHFTCNVSTATSWKSATYILRPSLKMSPKVTIPCVDSMVPEKSLKWNFNYIHTILSRRGAEVSYAPRWRRFVENVSESGSLILKDLSHEQQGVFVCELHTGDITYFSRTQLGNKATDHMILYAAGFGAPAVIIMGIIVFLLVRQRKKEKRLISEEQLLLRRKKGKDSQLHNMLMSIFEELPKDQLEKLKQLLSDQTFMGSEFQSIPRSKLRRKKNISKAMIATYDISIIRVTKRVLHQLKREDLVKYLAGDVSDGDMSPELWSALVLMLSSNSNTEEFDARKYYPTEKDLLKLLPVIKGYTNAILSGCGLSQTFCTPLSSILSSSRLKHLDLSNNDLQDSGVEQLCVGLTNTSCTLESLNLALCVLSAVSCAPLASVLRSSSLTLLDLSNNDLGDSGVEQLCEGLKNTSCRLETLRLSGCLISESGVDALTTALNSTFPCLRELDLTYNHPGAAAQRMRENPHCTPLSLRLEPNGEQFMVPGLRKYACELTLEPASAHKNLRLSENHRSVEYVWEEQPYPDHEDRFTHWEQVLSSSCLSGRCYWEVQCGGQRPSRVAVSIAVSYGGITRTEKLAKGKLGLNAQSWSLCLRDEHYIVRHKGTETTLSYPFSLKVGVFLDCEAGALSFYQVLPDGKLCHIHTFNAEFTEPLFAGFEVGFDSRVTLLNMK